MVWRPLYCVCGKFTFQQRYVMVLLSFFSIICAYNHRVSLNLILNAMVPHKPPRNDSDYCPRDAAPAHEIQGDVRNWTAMEQSIVKLTFFGGYVVSHVPAGYLCDVYGGRLFMIGCLVVSTVTCALAPLCVIYGDWPLLSGSRVIMGLAQGFVFPASSSLLARWVPKEQRSFLGAITFSGGHVGTIVGTAVSGIIAEVFNSWPLVFYTWALLSAICIVLCVFSMYSGPASHPYVTDEEKALLAEKIPTKQKKTVPWLKILGDIHVWAIIVGQVGHGWMYFTLATDLPNYLKNVQGFDIKKNGLVSSLPFLALAIASVASGKVADVIIAKGVRVVTVRRVATIIGNMVASAILLVVPYLGCNKILVVAIFTISMLVKGPFYCGVRVNHLDVSSHFAGILTAFVNGLGAVSGVLTPYVVGAIAPEHTISQWRLVFWINFAVSSSLTIFYVIFTSGERAEWDKEMDEAK